MILIFFGSSGDLAYLQQLIDEEGFHREALAQHSLLRNGWQVEYFTVRLTVYSDRTQVASVPN